MLLGMAGAGKSTVGVLLADHLGWAHVDTDRCMEAYFGAQLQQLMDAFGLEQFLHSENLLVASLGLRRSVISTGGSVIYGADAVNKLRMLGATIYLQARLDTLEQRIKTLEGRALAIRPGQSFADLWRERHPLYLRAADLSLDTDDLTPEQCMHAIIEWLTTEP